MYTMSMESMLEISDELIVEDGDVLLSSVAWKNDDVGVDWMPGCIAELKPPKECECAVER